jgi:hypothetical protein
VDHLGAGALDDPPHNVDGGVVAIEERGSSNDPDLVLGDVGGGLDEGHGAKLLSNRVREDPAGSEAIFHWPDNALFRFLAALSGCPL